MFSPPPNKRDRYRVARNFDVAAAALSRQWDAYLARAVALAVTLGSPDVGFMDGTVFRELLLAVQAEAAADPANSTLAGWATALDANMRARAVGWSTALWPYGSEFAYDTTGQEEVFIWLTHYGYSDAANRTLEAVLAYMRALPNWAWHGGARSGGDLGNNGLWFVNRGSERMLQHYRAGLNQIVLSEAYRAAPDDAFLLRVAMGALTGQLASIAPASAPASPGAVSMGFHSVPFVNDHDPRSGDFGLGFFGISLEAAAYLVRDAQLPGAGWACYLCNLGPGASASSVAFAPVDGYRIRAFIEPIGVFLVAQAGVLRSIAVDFSARTAAIEFEAATAAPAAAAGPWAARPFSALRLQVTKTAPSRPGAGFAVAGADSQPCPLVRGAFACAPNANDALPTTVTLSWSA